MTVRLQAGCCLAYRVTWTCVNSADHVHICTILSLSAKQAPRMPQVWQQKSQFGKKNGVKQLPPLPTSLPVMHTQHFQAETMSCHRKQNR